MQVINNKPTLELQQDEETLRAQLFALRVQGTLGKLEKVDIIKKKRKEIARIKTELSFRILNGEIIKPLNVNKMVLAEDKKEIKKSKKIAKDEKKPVKSKEIVEAVSEKEQKSATNKKTAKPKVTAAKSKTKTPSSKKTTKPQEDKA